jgi:hypothetical protein
MTLVRAAGLPKPSTIVEGHRPRCPCCTRDIKRIETFVPVGTEAGAPPIAFLEIFVPAAGEAAVPPIVSAIIIGGPGRNFYPSNRSTSEGC